MDLATRVKGEVAQKKLFRANDKVVIGVSGGMDSVVLLDIISKILNKKRIIVAHVDHGLRKDSGKDLAFVRSLARKYGVKFYSKKIKGLKDKTGNLEELARNERYDFFLKAAKKEGARTILTAHHADDQLETILLNFQRGADVRGLGGMHQVRAFSEEEKNIYIVRPLLNCFRSEIEEYQRRHGLDFRLDITNKDITFKRNYLRHKILTNLSLKEKKNILSEASKIKETYKKVREEIGKILKLVSEKKRNAIILNREKFNQLGEGLRQEVLVYILDGVFGCPENITAFHIRNIVGFAKENVVGKELQLPGMLRVVLGYDSLIMLRGKLPSLSLKPRKLRDGENKISELGISVLIGDKAGSSEFLFDYNSINLPLYLRSYKKGDRFIPLGMRGSKKLQDFFTDEKVDRDIREATPVITDKTGKIIYILGLRQSRDAVAGKNTRKYMSITFKKTEGVAK